MQPKRLDGVKPGQGICENYVDFVQTVAQPQDRQVF